MVTAGRAKARTDAPGRGSVDLRAWWDRTTAEFLSLDPREPGQWPLLPKVAAWVAAAVATVALGWLLVVGDRAAQLGALSAQEPGLKSDFSTKLRQAINLSELRKQKLLVQEYVNQLERQLPSRAEFDALLSDINQAGLGRGLAFESLKPSPPVLRDYYAELPIAIQVVGPYHELGAFMADIASFPRIVTVDGIALRLPSRAPGAPAAATLRGQTVLTLEATARTYRYLDTAETEAQQKARDAAARGRR